MLVDNLCLPAEARHADGTDLVDVLHTQMDTARADGFTQAIVGVILMVREIFLPAADEGRRNRLCADVHQSPLIQLVIFYFKIAAVERIQDILCPRHKQPDNRALFLGHSFEHILRLGALEQDCLASGNQAAEPVHFRARVVQRRNAKEHIVLRLAMVRLLDACGVHQALMVM